MLIALTRPVPKSINRCELTHLAREPIDLARAREQHDAYERALQDLGCTIHRLPALHDLPDSVFVEDTAVVLPEAAVMARLGSESRRGEIGSVAAALQPHRPLFAIEEPGTLDGGDVLAIGKRIFVGRSSRTNEAGIAQLRQMVEPFGYRVSTAAVRECLHLKSAATLIGEAVLCNARWVDVKLFDETIETHPAERFAANALLVNGSVLYPAAYPRTRARLARRGISVQTVDADELAKAEGGLTCCSIVFEV